MKNQINHIFIDPGSSGTKVLFQAASRGGFFVPPGVTNFKPLNEEVLEEEKWISYEFGCGVLELNGKPYRVGVHPKICVTAQTKAPRAVAKAIAIIASVDKGTGLTYEVNLLLPCDEFKSHKAMEEQILECLPTAKFKGEPVKAKVSKIKTSPEGSGLIPRPQGVQVAVMVGHTDISLIRFEQGRINGTRSRTFPGVGIGAIALSMQIPGSDIEIATAISKGKFSELQSDGFSEALIREVNDSHKQSFVETEIEPLLKAYPWSGVDSVVIGGGGASYLRKEISELIPVKVKKSSSKKGLRLFGVNEPRFHDLYGMAYRQLSDSIESALSREEVKPVECEVA